MRSGMPLTSIGSVTSSLPTTKATRYELMIIVSAKRITVRPSATVRSISGPLEMAVSPSATSRVTPKTALNSGSSQHGNARRQSVDCIWVVAMTCCVPVVVDVGAAVEAAELVVEDPGELDRERRRARRDRRGRRDDHAVGRLVERPRGVGAADRADVIVNSAALRTRWSVSCATSSWMATVPRKVASSSDGRSRRS